MTDEAKQHQLQWGLSHIFKGVDSENHMKCGRDTPLWHHPFGFEIQEHELGHLGCPLVLLGYPGNTDESVDSMIAHIRHFVAGTAPQTGRPNYLRVIYGESDPHSRANHFVYFEISSGLGTFICGGCTDCSGTGKSGTQELESVFALLSLIYDVEIETINVPYLKADTARRAMEDYYEEFRDERMATR